MPQRCFEVSVNGGVGLMITDDAGLVSFPRYFDTKGMPIVPYTGVDATSGDLPLPAWWVPMAEPVPPVPPLPSSVSRKAFLVDRLGMSVVAQVMSRAAAGDSLLAAFVLVVQTTEPIHLDDPATVQGVGYLEQIGILTADDVARILTPEV